MAETRPFEICDVAELTALQLLPFHFAMRSALAIPPALVNSPPTYRAPGAVVSEEATRSSESLPGVPRSPRWPQPPGPAASAQVASAPIARADMARTRSRRRARVELSLPIRNVLSVWEAVARPRVSPD